MALPAKVIHIMGRSGAKGVTRVRCTVVDESAREQGPDKKRHGIGACRRFLMVKESDMEDAGIIE